MDQASEFGGAGQAWKKHKFPGNIIKPLRNQLSLKIAKNDPPKSRFPNSPIFPAMVQAVTHGMHYFHCHVNHHIKP